jgi:hypothetical protein
MAQNIISPLLETFRLGTGHARIITALAWPLLHSQADPRLACVRGAGKTELPRAQGVKKINKKDENCRRVPVFFGKLIMKIWKIKSLFLR